MAWGKMKKHMVSEDTVVILGQENKMKKRYQKTLW